MVVFMVDVTQAGGSALDAATIAASKTLFSTPVADTDLTNVALDNTRKAFLAEQEHLERETTALEARERELNNTIEHHRRPRP